MTIFRIFAFGVLLMLISCNTGTDANQTSFNLTDYYPLNDGNEWRYTAPENWKDGDYISKIVQDTQGFENYYSQRRSTPDFKKKYTVLLKKGAAFRHYDATKTAKLLLRNEVGLYYIGEAFSGGESFVLFDQPFIWFPSTIKMAENLIEERNFTRFYKDGRRTKGLFRIIQTIPKLESVEVPAGKFANCLRVEFTTYWNFGNGSEAKSINVYHHAKGVGVVKAAARFVILQNGKELVNRLVEPDLKSYKLF